MKNIYKYTIIFIVIVSILYYSRSLTVLVAPSLSAHQNQADSPALSTPESLCDLGAISIGTSQQTLPLCNNTDHALEIIGFRGGCGDNYCCDTLHLYHITLEPHRTFDYHYFLTVHEPKTFCAKLILFYHDSTIKQLAFTVKGTGKS